MLITHDIRPQGHYVTIHRDNITLTIRTEHGAACEIAAEAVDMRKKASLLIRNADLIRDAIYSDQWYHRTPADHGQCNSGAV